MKGLFPLVPYQIWFDNSHNQLCCDKELYILPGNFCEGTWILKIIARAKVDARAVLLKKSTGFSSMSLTASLLRLGALLRDNLQMGAFF